MMSLGLSSWAHALLLTQKLGSKREKNFVYAVYAFLYLKIEM